MFAEKKWLNLEKMYLDCIDTSGNCFIIYWAKLNIYFFRLFYSGMIFSDTRGEIHEKSLFSWSEKPAGNSKIHFDFKDLLISGTWHQIDDSYARVLYKEKRGENIIWNCHHPKSLTEIKYLKSIYKGYGYAETLILPGKCWDLPINILRWGRFLSDYHSVVWINWEGSYPVNRIFLNGTEYNDGIFKEDSIVFSRGTCCMVMTEIQTIRNGKLINLLSGKSLLKYVLGEHILNISEAKYKARSVFNENSISRSEGWSLFEIVTWGN